MSVFDQPRASGLGIREGQDTLLLSKCLGMSESQASRVLGHLERGPVLETGKCGHAVSETR